MKKAGDIEVKANLQPPFYVREFDSWYPKYYCLLAKKDKKDIYWEPRDEAFKDKNKVKFQTSSFANQPQAQDKKKNKRGYQRGHPATRVNTTEVVRRI